MSLGGVYYTSFALYTGSLRFCASREGVAEEKDMQSPDNQEAARLSLSLVFDESIGRHKDVRGGYRYIAFSLATAQIVNRDRYKPLGALHVCLNFRHVVEF